MKRLFEIIADCFECSHVYYGPGFNEAIHCGCPNAPDPSFIGYTRDDPDIPEWCPLPEYAIVDCLGCQNIIQGNFPMRYHTTYKAFILDTEGCWDGGDECDKSGGEWYIHYCPVCGRPLKELLERILQ